MSWICSFCASGIQAWLSWVNFKDLNQGANWFGLIWGIIGEGFASKLMWCWQRSILCGLLDWGPQFLAVSQKLPSLPHHQGLPHTADYFLKTIREERVSSQDGHYILCHYFCTYKKNIYCHLCCIQLIRNKNSSHSYSWGENNQRCKHQKAGILGTTLESVYHTYFLKSFQFL